MTFMKPEGDESEVVGYQSLVTTLPSHLSNIKICNPSNIKV